MILIKNQTPHPYPPIKKKLLITSICLLLPVVLFFIYQIFTNTTSALQSSESEFSSYMDEFYEVLETHLQPTGNIITAIEDNTEIRSHLKNRSKKSAAKPEEPRALKEVINSPIIYKNFFKQPAVNAVTIFYEDSLEYYSLENASLDLALDRCLELNKSCQELDLTKGQFIAPANGTAYGYWVQEYRNIYENHYYGRIIIELNPVPNSLVDNVNPGQSRYPYSLDLNRYANLQYWLTTDSGAIIFSNTNTEVGTLVHNCLPSSLVTKDHTLPAENSDYYIHRDSLTDWGLSLYLIAPKQSVLQIPKLYLQAAVLIVILAIYCFVSVILIRRLLAPFEKLHDYYKLVQDQPMIKPVFAPVCREVSETQEVISNKIDEIQILQNECETLQSKIKDYEIKSLQAQINPHFLFNMLDVINWKASNTGSDDISNMVIQLSEMLHSNILFNGHQKITIRQELEYIQNYLVLQQISMAVNFQYKINVDDEILDIYQLPKLCLQPIVENCIVHGFSDIHYEGLIVISIWEETDGILCRIEDNGKGFQTDALSSPEKKTPSSNGAAKSHHIALKNISERLTMLYGAKYGLTIDSIPHKGTVVTVHIPFDRIKNTKNAKEE